MSCPTTLGGRVRRATAKICQTPKVFRRRKKKGGSEVSEAVLDQVRLLFELVGSVADGPLNVPLLKVVCTLAEKLVEIAQTVRFNRGDCNTLVEHICDHLSLIATTYHPDLRCGEPATEKECLRLNNHVDRLHRALEDILATVKKLASRPKLHRFLHCESDRRKIAACQVSLRHIIDQFQMGVAITDSHTLTAVRTDMTQLKDQSDALLICSSRIQHNQNVIIISSVLFA